MSPGSHMLGANGERSMQTRRSTRRLERAYMAVTGSRQVSRSAQVYHERGLWLLGQMSASSLEEIVCRK